MTPKKNEREGKGEEVVKQRGTWTALGPSSIPSRAERKSKNFRKKGRKASIRFREREFWFTKTRKKFLRSPMSRNDT